MLRHILVMALTTWCLSEAEIVGPLTADRSFLHKQKLIYDVLWHQGAAEQVYSDMEVQALSWDIGANRNSYTDKVAVEEFLQRYEHGMLPQGEIFSLDFPVHREEAVALFRLFWYAEDFQTFYKTALWARSHVNEGQFLYAIIVAVIHRPDTRYIRIPAPYEMFPNFFFNSDVIQKALATLLQGGVEGVDRTVIIPANYSGWQTHYEDTGSEYKLNYFVEDIGLNGYYYYLNQEFPFWMTSDEFGFIPSYRGEQYFYSHKLLLARYYLERLSNDLGEIEHFDWDKPIEKGYHPTLSYQNGLPFPVREHWSMIPAHKYKYLQDLRDLESRITYAIDSGFITDKEHKLFNIYSPEGLGLLGSLMEGNADSYNEKLYGCLHSVARNILGFNREPTSKYRVVPSALQHFSTSLRDPAFYRLYKRIVNYYLRYKQHLPAYTLDELVFPGVKIESATVDRLATFFDLFDTDLTHVVPMPHMNHAADPVTVKARSYRLNHKPFNFRLTVSSSRATKGVVRVFLGPKYDVFHNELDISENYMNFYEIDNFIVELVPGRNKIERSSVKAYFTIPDQDPSEVFYKKLRKAMEGSEVLFYDEKISGFPGRLILPKGKPEGLPLQFFFYVSHFDEAVSIKVDSPVWGKGVFDDKPMGFPMDKPIQAFNFTVPNMFFKDVKIYHEDLI